MHVSPFILFGGFFLALYIGLGIGLNRARRSWVRGYAEGSIETQRLAARALHQQRKQHELDLVTLAGALMPVPESPEVRAERRKQA